MTDHLQLIRIKLDHLARMREYLAYSLGQVQKALLLKDWNVLSPEQHESMAAFWLRFSEFQEHLGKTMTWRKSWRERSVPVQISSAAPLRLFERLTVLRQPQQRPFASVRFAPPGCFNRDNGYYVRGTRDVRLRHHLYPLA